MASATAAQGTAEPEPGPAPSMFAAGGAPMFATAAPRPDDVAQGSLDDCWLLASLIALARVNPQAVERLIHDRGDGSYDVTLYMPSVRADDVDNTDPSKKKPKTVRVYPDPSWQGAWPRENRKEALWPRLFEQAAAQLLGGPQQLHTSTDAAGSSFTNPGGNVTLQCREHSPDDMARRIDVAFRKRCPITATTVQSPALNQQYRLGVEPEAYMEVDKFGAMYGHAYALMDIDVAGGTIGLYNPHGVQHLRGLPMLVFEMIFADVTIGDPV